jgi:hypothetical protein
LGTRLATFVLAAFALLAPSTAANAASIGYVSGGNVHLSAPDGSLARQITTAGTNDSPYNLAGVADSGKIVASFGPSSSKTWFFFNPDGSTRSEGPNLVPMKSCGSAIGSIGPLSPRLHPDGSMAAYNYFCNYGPPSFGSDVHLTVDTPHNYTMGSNTPVIANDLTHPTWFGNRLVVSDGTNILIQEDHPDSPYRLGFSPWLGPGPGVALNGAEISRQGNRFLVEYTENSAKAIDLYNNSGSPPGGSFEFKCTLAAGGNPNNAAFSPDGNQIAWQDDGGVKVGTLDLNVPGCLASGSVRTLAPGGSAPRFSAYTVTPLGPGGGGLGTGGGAAPAVTFSLAGQLPRLLPALNRGVPFFVRTNRAARALVQLLASGPFARGVSVEMARTKVVGRGSRSLPRAGRYKVVAKFTRKAKRRYRRMRKVTLTARVTVRASGGGTTTKRKRITLRR